MNYSEIKEQYLRSKSEYKKSLLKNVYLYYIANKSLSSTKAIELCCLAQLFSIKFYSTPFFAEQISAKNYLGYLGVFRAIRIEHPSLKLLYDPHAVTLLNFIYDSFGNFTEFQLYNFILKSSSL